MNSPKTMPSIECKWPTSRGRRQLIALTICFFALSTIHLNKLASAQNGEEAAVASSERAPPDIPTSPSPPAAASPESMPNPPEPPTIKPDASRDVKSNTTGRGEQLTVIAPRYLRPQSDYHVLINLANSTAPATIDLQLIGARDSNQERTEAKSILIGSEETQTIKFEIGPDWPAAEYVLSVSAQAVDKSWSFSDEKQIAFQSKTFSAFIQTDKAIYKPGQLVQFRALFLTPELRPKAPLTGAINVTIENPKRAIIKQWHYLSSYRGLLSLEMPLSDDPMLGDYTIKVSVQDQTFVKGFSVAEYILPTYDVIIELPPYATKNESDIVVSVRAAYTYGKPVEGHVTLTVQPLVRFSYISTRPLEQAQFRARLPADSGKADFKVDIIRDLKLSREDYFEREIEFFALVEENLTGRTYNKTATLKMYDTSTKIERLGKAEADGSGDADLKPGLSQVVRYKVAYQDDTPVEDNGPPVELRYEVWGAEVASFTLTPVGGLIEHELRVPRSTNASQRNSVLWGDSASLDQTRAVDISASYRKHKHHLSAMRARYSESNQHLQIVLPQLDSLRPVPRLRPRAAATTPTSGARVSVGDQLKVVVRATEPMRGQVTCQGLSRGDIVWALSKSAQNKTEFDFDVVIEARMAPESRILCFYVRPENKELIADSRLLAVSDGLVRNLVKLTPSRSEAKPGQELEVGVFTKPNSLVGVLGIDQSALLLKAGNDLSAAEIARDLKSYGAPRSPDHYLGSPDTRGLFESANVVVLTNNRVHDWFDPNIRYFANAGAPASDDFGPMSSRPNEAISLSRVVLEGALPPPEFHLKARDDVDQVRIRSVFPETWLWENGTADTQGQVSFSARVPDSITSWQLSAFSLNEAHGLALSQGKTLVRVFKPFFIRLNLPYSVIRGETLVIQAVVFNYGSKRAAQALVTLDNKAGEFEFVELAANSIDDEKYSGAASQSRRVQVPPGGAGASVSFLIKPVKVGNIDIKVVARSELAGDGEARKLLVKAEGQTQHFNKAALIQLPGPQSSWRQNISLAVPANIVPGSQRVYVSAIGDILGAGLSNVDDLLRLPYGCGEQNMINLVPNIVILNYLQASGRVRDVQRERAIKNIETGYQRQLNYKRSDGSFSAFGPSDANGSVWLTAYVLRTLKQAKRHITIDDGVLSRAAAFIASHALPDGSIEEVGMLHDKRLASSALGESPRESSLPSSKRKSKRSIYLTAYSLAALLERQAQQGAPGSERDHNDQETRDVIERGLKFLEQQLGSGGDDSAGSSALSTYELSIIAYVLELAGGDHKPAANAAYERLWDRGHVDQSDGESVHWSEAQAPAAAEKSSSEREGASDAATIFGSSDLDSLATQGRNAKQVSAKSQPPPPLKPPLVDSDQSAHLFVPDSLDVEMTSWALLTAVRRNELDRAPPIVRWLVSKQNSNGGFASTQDTVLAIQALASYAEASAASMPKAAAQSVEVEYVYPLAQASNQSASPGAFRLRKTGIDQVLVSQANALVQQQTRLPDNVTWVQVQATGAGLAVVQVSWQYNLLVSAERPAFYLNPVVDRRSDINYLQLSICTFYAGADGSGATPGNGGNRDAQQQQQQQQQSNMAVCEIELPSGYVADLEALPSLRRHAQIKRVDTLERETKVIVYLDSVSRTELCFTVPAHRSSKVSNNKPVPVTIYDYYDRKQAARIFYEPQLASSCDICAESGACGDSCAKVALGSMGAGARSGRLVSVHDERNRTLAAHKSAKIQAEPANSTTGDSFGLFDASQLLPLRNAFSALDAFVRSANSSRDISLV